MHTTTLRRAGATAAIVLLGVTAACGGSSGGGKAASDGGAKAAPTVSVKEFCAAETSTPATPKNRKDKAAMEKAWKDWVQKISIGTPSGIPSDAKAGYAVYLQKMNSIDWSKSLTEVTKQAQGLESSLSASEKKQTEAFDAYVKKTCHT